MEKDYRHLEQLDDTELSENDKRNLYCSLSNDAMKCFDDYVFDMYKGNFVGIKRIGEEYSNNLEFNATFEYDQNTANHYLKDLNLVVNEVHECTDGLASHTIFSSTLEFSEQTLSNYRTDYYLLDSLGESYLKVFLDHLPEKKVKNKLGKRLRELEEESEDYRQILTKEKLNRLLYIIESVLDENEIQNNFEDSEDDFDGYD
jgi:ubiquitin C-terminal hydrolase